MHIESKVSWVSVHMLHGQTRSAHYALHGAVADGSVEWTRDFEVDWGREQEAMDLCFTTCFTDTLPCSATPGHLQLALQTAFLLIQSWQWCIIHPDLLLLYVPTVYMLSFLLPHLSPCSPCAPWQPGSWLNVGLHALTVLLSYAWRNVLLPPRSV